LPDRSYHINPYSRAALARRARRAIRRHVN
jgi:hypothetical protein